MNIKPINSRVRSPVLASSTGERDGTRHFAPSPRRLPTPLSLLVLANAVSLIGNVVMTVAIPWLVLTTTGSAAAAGIAVFASVGGAAVGGLAAGRIVDAIGPVRTSSAADLISGLAVAPLPTLLALDALEIWHVVLLSIVGSLADSAGSSARQSLVPAVAASDGYGRERANALFTSAEHVGYLVGAPIAGLLIAVLGVGGALWVTVASFASASSVVAWLVHLPRPRAVAARVERAGLREAIAFIWADPALRALFAFPTAAVLLVGPLAPLVLPVLARETFGNPVVLGVMVASYGAGGLLGAAGFGMLGSRVPRRRLYNGVFVVWPCTYAAITLVPFLPITLAMLLTLGAAAGSLVPLQATIRQERSPAHLLPRVVGLSTASVPVSAPIGVLVTGFLIDRLGLHQTLLLMTAGAALIGTTVLTSKWTELFDANEATQSRSTVQTVPVTAGCG
jgi:predicted MFS family arabinose efflux permease